MKGNHQWYRVKRKEHNQSLRKIKGNQSERMLQNHIILMFNHQVLVLSVIPRTKWVRIRNPDRHLKNMITPLRISKNKQITASQMRKMKLSKDLFQAQECLVEEVLSSASEEIYCLEASAIGLILKRNVKPTPT